MGIAEIAINILGVTITVGSIVSYIAWHMARRRVKYHVLNILINQPSPDEDSINAIRAQMEDKYGKQTEEVARIVSTYSSIPLKDVLKVPELSDEIYRGLSPRNPYR